MTLHITKALRVKLPFWLFALLTALLGSTMIMLLERVIWYNP